MNEPTDEQIDEIVRRVISGPCPAEGHGGLLVLAGWRAAQAAAPPSAPTQIRVHNGRDGAWVEFWTQSGKSFCFQPVQQWPLTDGDMFATIASEWARDQQAMHDAAQDAAPPSAPAPAGDLADAIAANAGVLHATIATLTEERDKAHKDMRESLDRWNKANGESNDDFMLLSDKHTLMTDRAERAEAECAKLRGVVRGIVDTYDNYRRRGVAPAPAEYVDVVKAIDAARAEEKA